MLAWETLHAKIRYDDDFMYVGAFLEEPDVWANMTEDESVIFHDNDFEVFTDSDGSNVPGRLYALGGMTVAIRCASRRSAARGIAICEV